MTQLKTLKNLNVILNTNYYPDKKLTKLTNLVPIYDLRQEAIKWIKELIREINFKNKQIDDWNNIFRSSQRKNILPHEANLTEKKENFLKQIGKIDSQILWIKHFFNITDEELKLD